MAKIALTFPACFLLQSSVGVRRTQPAAGGKQSITAWGQMFPGEVMPGWPSLVLAMAFCSRMLNQLMSFPSTRRVLRFFSKAQLWSFGKQSLCMLMESQEKKKKEKAVWRIWLSRQSSCTDFVMVNLLIVHILLSEKKTPKIAVDGCRMALSPEQEEQTSWDAWSDICCCKPALWHWLQQDSTDPYLWCSTSGHFLMRHGCGFT